MINEELIKNYEKALEQKYNAVCFDIDGTLTESQSIKIDLRIMPFLADILKRHIPIVFITGRGETGLTDLLKDIISELKNNYQVTEKQLSKMYAVTNDGARLFMTKKNSGEYFNDSYYISSEEDFKKLAEIDYKIKSILESSSLLSKYCTVTNSVDSKTGKIINIRLLLSNNNVELKNKIMDLINNLIKASNNLNLNLTLGIYKGKQILQIGTATKNKAIQITEKLIGIPQNSMLRIGDCGDINENDYSMLNCPQGFSVDKISDDVDKCFPVIENGKIITGVDGTLSLLKKVKLLPTICLEHATQEDYAKAYSKIEKQLVQGKNKNLVYFNNLINSKYGSVDGVNDLFDVSSGSVKIPMYEWICIPEENPLKELWLTDNNQNLIYSMYDNQNILLRGSGIYYYFLSHRIHDEESGLDLTTKAMIDDWLNNNFQFFSNSLFAISKVNDLNELKNLKMILGIIDNIRNYLLIILNYEIVNRNSKNNAMINLAKYNENILINNIYNILLEVESLMANISFNGEYKVGSYCLKKLLSNVLLIISMFKNKFDKELEKENYSKDFRAYREIDNFAENYITCYLTMQKDSTIINKGICGICYGGLELPIIMKAINNKIEDVSILKFNINVTGYSKKQALELRFFDIYKAGGIDLFSTDKQKKYILFDDNILTGKTMQLATTALYDVGILVDKIVTVRYPSVNRISQMFMPNHGAVDYKQFFDYIEGLYYPSPYSWRDPHSHDPYEDSLGIFDINRRKILECLIKNGDYSKQSEVQYIRRPL